MKKLLLALVIFLSFVSISRSDPPEGYQYDTYEFTIKNWDGELIEGVTATVSGSRWIDLEASTMRSGDDGTIIIKFLVPATDADSEPAITRDQVTFSACGYEDAVYPLSSYRHALIVMEYAQ